jgi:tetratricopeptide (TPR) repeat protein
VTANQALRARFEAKPEDAVAFAALEEALFVAGDWRELLSVYERRLAAKDLSGGRAPKQRARVLLRRAQVQGERLHDEEAALASLREATLLDDTLRPAMAQLRQLLVKRGDWDAALALAEAEAKLPMRPSERAQLASEAGALWLDKRGDPAKARTCYERALEAEASFAPAWLGLANAAEASGAPADAVRALERAAELLRGADRAAALSRLAKLQRERLGDATRAAENFRRALSDDPQQIDALEAMAERALASQQWAQFDELQDRRFALAKDRLARLAVAHEAGRVQLEKAANPGGARIWFKRALELFPGDPVVHLYLADAARMLGEQELLARHLRRATELADNAAPIDALLESADLEGAHGNAPLALAQLRRAFERDPQRSDVAEQLTEALAHNGREDELVEWVEAQLAAGPGATREAALWSRLGAFHEERRGDAATAFDAYAQALDAVPADEATLAAFERVARKLERWEPLAERLNAGAEASPGAARASLFVRLGQLHSEREDLDSGRAAFDAALEANPDDKLARQGVERIALATGDHETILASFEREAESTADRDRLAFLVGELACIHEARGDVASALKWRQRLSAARPEEVSTLGEIARLQRALGERAAEAATLTRLEALQGGVEQLAIRRRLAALYAELADAEAALRAHRAVLASDANDLASARAVANLLGRDASIDERVSALRHLVAIASGEECVARQFELGCLLMDEAGDLHGAGACFETVVDAASAPVDAEGRFVEVLSRLGHWDVVCARLDLRRRLLDPLDPRALDLDLDRAEILIDRLGRAGDATTLCETVREANPRHARAREVLERALRANGDDARLVKLLEERGLLEADRERRALLDMERALLFEQRLRSLPEARGVLAEIAAGESAIALDAERRLRQLLEDSRDWPALAERLASALGRGDGHDDFALHRQLAALHRDRLRDVDTAISHFERALTFSPADLPVLHALQALLEQTGREAALCAAFERELEAGAESERKRTLHARCAEICERASDLARAEAHHRSVLELDPGAPHSVQFLGERYERAGRTQELADLLRAHLAQLPGDANASVALRLRLAKLEADALGDLSAAIATLRPAAEREETFAIAAAPLADLLARARRSEELIALAQRAVERVESAAERSAWRVRLGDAELASGDLEAAADAYRRALSDRPSDPDLQATLRDLYRQLRRAEPLARLLAAELGRTAGPREVPLRLELGGLLAGELRDPAGALVHYRRALELEPGNADALDRAISAAEQAGANEASDALLAEAAKRTVDPSRRARLLARRAALLAGPLARPRDAVACYEESLALVPDAAGTLAALRGVLEDRADWPGLLACFERELTILPPDDANARLALITEAVRFANEMIGPEAALPWLERLHAARPQDAEPLARIAHAHRSAGRTDALLRTLEAELALSPPSARRVELALESAQLLCDRLNAPARAAAVLEAAREANPHHPELLAMLDRLYEAQQRPRDRLDVVQARVATAGPAARLELRKTAAALARALGEHEHSAAQLWAALGECGPIAHERAQLLRLLSAELTDRPDLWVRAAEAELAALDPGSPVFAERRRALRAELAVHYASRLAAPETAIAHWIALLDHELPRADERLAGARAEASDALIDALRRVGDPVNLARRLGERLAEFPSAAAEPWLELGQLHLEVLHQPAAAAHAFQMARERDAGSLTAVRGSRGACELLGRWREVAASLESELALRSELAASERAALLRRLGEVSWHRLDETTRASRAYASALEADPHDLISLRALQLLFEAMEDWRGALDLYESEIEVLADALPARRRECWLRAAEIATVHASDLARALRCTDAAARIAKLETSRLLQLAELLDRLGERERFVETFAAWLDAPDAVVGAHDELRLADALEKLERFDSALARADRACERAPRLGEAWDRCADLHERLGRTREAATALERSADLTGGAQAARRRVRAADLLGNADDERRALLLAGAAQEDPLCAEAFAKLALAAAASGDVSRAESAAERAIALAGGGTPLAPNLRRDAALCGARAALALDHTSVAGRLLADALALAPDHAEALAQYGRTLLRLGDVAGARSALSRALERSSAPRDRAALLAQLGNAEAAARANGAALAHFRAALEIEPALGEAYSGLVPLLMSEQREAEAIEALTAWAALEAAPAERAKRMLQAAELELGRAGREAAAEELLCGAVAQDAGSPTAWALLAELQARQGRWSEVVESAKHGASVTRDASLHSRLEALRGRALEQRGELRAAADAFASASQLSPRASEAALSAARLLRGLGEWRGAADVLRSFADSAPEDAVSARAAALHQLGRLLAGPLEDVDGAVEVYRAAAALQPDNRECGEALADLLLHRPRHWDEAIARHRDLLAADPARLASLRGLLRVARGRGNAAAASAGLALLRALGAATAEEAREAPARLPVSIAGRAVLTEPHFEVARKLAQEAASELGEALGGAQTPAVGNADGDVSARFRAAVTAAEGELSAACLVPLAHTELASALTLLAELGAEVEAVSSADGALVNALSRALGWRAKKRVRRALEGHTSDEIAAIDFAAWRCSLRALASALVVDRGECSLRDAFVAWIQTEDPDAARTLAPEADLRARIAAQPEARELLRLAVRAWAATL